MWELGNEDRKEKLEKSAIHLNLSTKASYRDANAFQLL
jgi:hypothetical protein